jgi:hypothetical protein
MEAPRPSETRLHKTYFIRAECLHTLEWWLPAFPPASGDGLNAMHKVCERQPDATGSLKRQACTASGLGSEDVT